MSLDFFAISKLTLRKFTTLKFTTLKGVTHMKMSSVVRAALVALVALAGCGLSAAPSDAAAEVLQAAQWKLDARGGRGAFRELVERLLRERGEWDSVVKQFESGTPEAQSV